MTKTMLASVALLLATSSFAFATAPVVDKLETYKANSDISVFEAKRSKKRVPGGSGCDDPGDVAEHAECRAGASLLNGKSENVNPLQQEAKRSKKRVPGGSGCDDPRDVIEHPECRV